MYLDTAILVKLFTPEPDSLFYARKVEEQIVVTSQIAYTEVASALIAKERNGSITNSDRHRSWREFEYCVDKELIRLLPVNLAVLKKANHILSEVQAHVPLRSLDAIHLASSDFAQNWPLLTNDKRMRQAAEYLRYPLSEVADG